MLQNTQVTIVTIHNYGKVYKVEGSVSLQHIRGDCWWKCRVVELYENFYTNSSFIKRRLKRCKVEQHNNSADKIFCVKKITAVYINLFKALVCCPLNDNNVTGFCARIVNVCLLQVVISHCCGKLAHADICKCGGDFNTKS